MIKLLLPFIVTIGLAAPTTAAIMTSQTLSGELGAAFLLPAGFSTTLDFDSFDNPGQTLTSVKLSFSTGFQSNFTVSSVNFGGPVSRQITLVRGIEGALSGNGFGISQTATVSKTNAVPRNTFLNPVSFGNYAPTAGNEQTLLAGNPVFTGPGPASFLFTARQFGNSLTGTPNLGGTFAVPDLGTASSFYDVTLTYESEAIPPVPEPASWAMMIAGFGLAGVALRRRRTAIA